MQVVQLFRIDHVSAGPAQRHLGCTAPLRQGEHPSIELQVLEHLRRNRHITVLWQTEEHRTLCKGAKQLVTLHRREDAYKRLQALGSCQLSNRARRRFPDKLNRELPRLQITFTNQPCNGLEKRIRISIKVNGAGIRESKAGADSALRNCLIVESVH